MIRPATRRLVPLTLTLTLTLTLSLGCGGNKKAPGGAASKPAPATHAGYASQAQVDGFLKECRATQTGTPAGADRVSGYGAVHRGNVPPAGRKVPPSDSFRWTQRPPEYLDPNLMSGAPAHSIGINLFEGLLAHAAGNGPPVPGAATRYEVSEDGRTYTFHLRKGNRWSDGKPLTANDFAYSWMRALDPKTGSKNAQQIWLYVVGAEDFNKGVSKDPGSVGIKVIDDLTIAVTLKSPTPYFPELITYIAWGPVPRHAVEKHGKQWTRPGNIVVNGAYTLEKFEPRSRIVLVKNEAYWDAANVAIPRSDVFMTDNEDTIVNYYVTGQVHLAQPLPPDKVRTWISQSRDDLQIDQHMCTYYLALRNGQPPFDDPLVRRALALAIDREKLAKFVLGRMERPATHFVPEMFEKTLGYSAVRGEGLDGDEAKRLLSEAGYPNGSGFPKVELRYNTLEVNRQVAEFVQRSLQENLGIKVALNNMEWKSMLKVLRTGEFQLARAAWCADYADPMTFLEVLRSTATVNYSRYNNPRYDALLDRITMTVDHTERNILMCAAEKTLNHDRPILPLFFYTHAYLLHPSVKGWEPQYQNMHMLKYLKLRP